jgi:hypothetical protein
MGAYGESGPTMVPVRGTYQLGESNQIAMQTEIMGYPPLHFRYIVSSDKLQLLFIDKLHLYPMITNGAAGSYHRVRSEK